MTSFNNIPDEPHYAIITTERIYIPGPYLSKGDPDYGTPGEHREFINYQTFKDKDAWLTKIKEYENPQYGSKKKYKAIEVKPAKIAVSIQVGVD